MEGNCRQPDHPEPSNKSISEKNGDDCCEEKYIEVDITGPHVNAR